MRMDRVLLAICFLLVSPASLPEEAASQGLDEILIAGQPPEEKLDELEPVVIVGGFATPRIWKVSKDDHVMWVLGNSAAPAGIKWRTEQMETRIAESQLMLYPGISMSGPDIGVFKAISLLTLVPSAFKAAKNPDDKTLKDVLPPEVYAKWRALKTTYVGRDNDIERWRPFIALGMLEDKIGEKLGAAPSSPIYRPLMGPPLRPLVEKAAKQHKVKVRTMPDVERKVKMGSVRNMLKSVRDVNLVDVKCVEQTLDFLELNVEYLKRKATGAQGSPPTRPLPCNEADQFLKDLRSGKIRDSGGILKLIDEVALQTKLAREQLEAEWIAAAQAALTRNKSTFAVLSMNDVKSQTAYLAKLKELGYRVEEPE